jgi:hypothetical protein
MEQGYLDPDTDRWVREKAARDYGGDYVRAVAAIVEGARAREARPDDPWAELDAQRRLSDPRRKSAR